MEKTFDKNKKAKSHFFAGFVKIIFILAFGFLITCLNEYINSINFWRFFILTISVVLTHFLIYSIIEGVNAKLLQWKFFIIYTVFLVNSL